jgi:hypothetical protein
METKEERIKILLSMPADFSRLLDRMLIDLKDNKIHMSKADLAIKLMRTGYIHEEKLIKR